MTRTLQDRRRLARILTFTVAVGLCFTVNVWMPGLLNADLCLPLSYRGDSLWTYTMVKTVEDTGR